MKARDSSKQKFYSLIFHFLELASERMIEFWKAALSLMINPDDKLISLPDGVNIFGSKSFGSAFIIRECYTDLWKLITEDKNYNGWIVTGNPGIGKSMFGFFLLIYLAKQGKTVIYEHFLMKDQHKFQPDGCVFKGEFRKELQDDNEAMKQFQKESDTASELIMPPWTKEEIMDNHRNIYSHISEDMVNKQYDLWGGIPSGRCANIVNDGKFSCETSHKIYHIYTTPPNYNNICMEFASPYACKKVVELYEQQHKSELLAFLKASNYGVWGSVCGNLFESYAHRVISRGGTFNVHELSQSATESEEINIEFPKYKLKKYKDISEIENNSYCIPHSKTNEGFDSLVPPNKFFSNDCKPCPSNKIKVFKKVKGLMDGEDICLYFVVPESTHKNFYKVQQILTSDKKITIDRWVNEIKQYALCINLDMASDTIS
ncbi:11903_t:CDS:2 [Entrophospora sp. SA101]|nr:11903_t:CDS:2 [Entrophospora sp. SA101]